MPFDRKQDSYKSNPPKSFDGNQNDWDDLSYDMQYYWWERRDDQYENRVKRVSRRRQWVNTVKSHYGCRLCKEDDPVALDFHHIGEKEAPVARMISDECSIGSVIDEMEKCDVICANCHRKLHAEKIDPKELSSIEINSELRAHSQVD